MSKTTIGILGCGWLGMPLAKKLSKLGYRMSGTTTSSEKLAELESYGIKAFEILLTEEGIEGPIDLFLSEIDTLIINIPPALRNNPEGDFVKKMEMLNKRINNHGLSHVLFVSSTSVYGNQDGEITEETPALPQTESGKQLLASEKLFFEQKNFTTTVIRFGGLIGPDRHPVYYLANKKNLKNGEELINLIHLNDCIHIMTSIIQNNYWGEIFNGVYPYHPTKKEYYTTEAVKRNLPEPQYNTSGVKNGKKRIISKNFLNKRHVLLTSIVS